MGVQSFKFPVDFLNNLEKPIIYIANKHKEILDSISVYDSLSLTCNLNAFQTASFKIYRDVDGKKQDCFKLFEEEMLIMIPGISWYEIHVETNIEPTGITKSITATSLECTLCNKRLVDFQVNSDDFEDDDYVITTFYNPTDPKKSLLNRVLNVSPVWTVGHVDQSLWDIQRTFDESDVDVYSFLTGTVSEAFNCLFTFDTFNCTVNAYDLDNYGRNTDIFVSMDNLAQNMTETIDENSIFTCYRITGGDDIQIAEVNPNGTNKIYNFEYYLPMMPVELQSKVKQYDAKYQELKPNYEDIVKRLGEQIYVIQELNTRYPDSLTSKDWTLYGLSGLETYKKSFETQNELFCAQGMNNPASLNYNLYTQNLENLNAVTAEYNKRLSEINEATNVYQSIVSEMKSLQSELDMNKWFTEDEWKILDSYVIEQTYSNDNFGAVDNTTEAELFSMEKELYDKAWEDLSKKCRPQYQYSSTISNILTIPEFKEFVPYFELGNFIQMETDYDTIVRLRIISFTVDYSNTQTINVTFSDVIRVKEMYDDISSIQAQANSAAMSFQFNKDQYDKTVKQGNFVAEMRKYGLDVATTAIHNATDQSHVWDETGFTFRKWNDERQDFDPEQIKIINNMMVFTDSAFDDTKMAIGKISLSNGTTAYGINAEVFVGTAIFSQYFTAQNPSGTFKIDDAGFSASNGMNIVKIQPNNSGELFSIYKGSSKQVCINSDGDVEFAGIIKGSGGVFSGLLQGGSINIGNNSFTVDENGIFSLAGGRLKFDGKTMTFSSDVTLSWGQITGTGNVASKNDIPTDVSQLNDKSGQKWSTTVGENWIKTADVYAQNLKVGAAKIQGTLTASQINTKGLIAENISADTISGKFLSGGSININDKFKVDKDGNVNASSGTFGGTINANDGNIGDFSISNGELSYGNFGVFGDSAQFMNISPKGKKGTVYMNSQKTCYVDSNWTFSSTSFGVNTLGYVFARKYNAYKDMSATCIEGDCITVNGARMTDYPKTIITGKSITINKNNKDEPTTVLTITGNSITADNGLNINGKTTFNDVITFSGDALTYGSSPGTEKYKVYRANDKGDDNIVSVGWIKAYLTNDYSPKGHSHSEYAYSGHNHSISNLTYSLTPYGNVELGSVNLATTTWVSNKFESKGSDIRLKEDIDDMQNICELYMDLKPKTYRFKKNLTGYDKRLHYGFIAQDIEESIHKLGLQNSNLVYKERCEGEINEADVIGDEYVYRVDKNELHAMHVQMIQKHQREIEYLQSQIKELERKIS